MNKVLLHCCCAPCSCAIIEWMLQNGIHPVLYYCNPNIYPEEEYLVRKNECTRYAIELGLEIVDDDYDHASWHCAIHGYESQPERGQRCLECFRMRLLSAARRCRDLGLTTFTTTLAGSRWKRLDQVTEAGHWAAAQVGGVSFDDRNWRKGGLQQRRTELIRVNGFYNQVYCGCEYSLAAREPHMQKDELRRWIRALKSVRSTEWRQTISRRICASLIADGLWRAAGTVLLYHAMPDEVDTSLLLDNALLTGKQVLLPVVSGNDLLLCPYSPDSLRRGAYGIMEPLGTPIPAERYSGIALAVVPGMAFDRCGMRLGRGKGY
ncbi:MAG: 5-formyltetrahydrofolate cyclo-ligase, partial [Bacteroidaceae bacterium]|nr:5-formyltetrahydrofolate cyclo-ligase [Bacteroidaceae bacterium]